MEKQNPKYFKLLVNKRSSSKSFLWLVSCIYIENQPEIGRIWDSQTYSHVGDVFLEASMFYPTQDDLATSLSQIGADDSLAHPWFTNKPPYWYVG